MGTKPSFETRVKMITEDDMRVRKIFRTGVVRNNREVNMLELERCLSS